MGAVLILYMLVRAGMDWIEPDPKGLGAVFLLLIGTAMGVVGGSVVVVHSFVAGRLVVNLFTLLPLLLNLFLCVILWPSLFNESMATLAIIPYATASLQVIGWGYGLWSERRKQQAESRF